MLTFLSRRHTDSSAPTEPETDPTETEQPHANVRMRFLTQGGAEVHITRVGTYTAKGYGGRSWGEHDDRWTCHGCDKGSDKHDFYSPQHIRDAANEHAQQCWSMPKPAVA